MSKMKRRRSTKPVGNAKKKVAQKTSTAVSKRGKTRRAENDTLKGHLVAEEEMVAYKKETKTARVEIRLSQQQQRSVEEAASILGFRNPTEYIRYTIQENARKVIKDQSILEIAERDRERFMRDILSPEPPGKTLSDAARHFKNTFKNK